MLYVSNMSNTNLRLIIAVIFLILSALTFRAAIERELWREFLVSELALACTAATLAILLASKKKRSKHKCSAH